FQILVDRDDPAGARRALEEAVRLAPGSVNLLVYLGQLEEQAGEYDAAITRYRHIVEMDPANVVALNNLAFALAVRRNAPTEARTFAKRAAAIAPTSGIVLDTLGWIEHLLGNDAVAANPLVEAIKLEPERGELRMHAAVVLMATGLRERSEAELKEALRLDPSLGQRDEVRSLRAPITEKP